MKKTRHLSELNIFSPIKNNTLNTSLLCLFFLLSTNPARALHFILTDCPVNGATVTHETCAGLNNGAASLNISGSGPYTYTWQPNVSTTSSATGLAAGNYSVTVTGGSTGSGTATSLYSHNFNGGATGWTLNTGSGSNQWTADANYLGDDCYFFGSPLFNVPDVPNQPASITGSPQSPYLHIRATNPGAGFCDPPWPPLNANYDADQTSNQFAEMSSPISTLGFNNITLTFWWLCVGGSNTYGYLQYSTGAGWTTVGGNFNGNATWQQASISNIAFDNIASLRFRFCWTNGTSGNDPAFALDEVLITGTPLNTCSSVVNFTINAGTSVNAAFTTLASNYCADLTAITLVPNVSGGTFSGQGVVGNVFTPRNVTSFNTPINITYTVTQNGCTATSTQTVIVTPLPDASFAPQLNATYLTGDPPIILTPTLAGGTFSSPCTASNVFIPSIATPNTSCAINYTVTQNGCTNTATQTVMVLPPTSGIVAELKVFLEGAFDSSTGLMNNHLQTEGYLPTNQPFGAVPWNYNGTESVSGAAQLPTNATDWVLVEARDAVNPNLLLDRQAGFVLRNGTVVRPNGTAGILFDNISAGNYMLSIRGRNHLPIITASSVSLPNVGNPYDFTNAANKAMGGANQQIQVSSGIWAMLAGDLNANGVINYSDYVLWASQMASGNTMNNYFKADTNLNGDVSTEDFDQYRPNAKAIAILLLRY